MTKTLPIGSTCLFYEHADTNQTPTAALVVGSNPAGILELACFPIHCTAVVTRRNVYHVSSEMLQKNKVIRIQYGGWDYVEHGEIRQQKSAGALDIVKKRHDEERRRREDELSGKKQEHEQQIIGLFDKNYTASDIADEMTTRTGYQWTFQKVNAILRKHSKLAAT